MSSSFYVQEKDNPLLHAVFILLRNLEVDGHPSWELEQQAIYLMARASDEFPEDAFMFVTTNDEFSYSGFSAGLTSCPVLVVQHKPDNPFLVYAVNQHYYQVYSALNMHPLSVAFEYCFEIPCDEFDPEGFWTCRLSDLNPFASDDVLTIIQRLMTFITAEE